MANAAEHVDRFVRRAKAGTPARMRVHERHLAVILAGLLRHGVRLAKECLGQIEDTPLREMIEAILLGGSAGAVLGAAVGSAFGPKGAALGGLVGAGVGVGAAAFAIVIRLRIDGDAGEFVVIEAAV